MGKAYLSPPAGSMILAGRPDKKDGKGKDKQDGVG
jgi:hypothetical protein